MPVRRPAPSDAVEPAEAVVSSLSAAEVEPTADAPDERFSPDESRRMRILLPAVPTWKQVRAASRAHTSRELHQEVWQLAWPAVTAMLLQTFNSLMDTFFVGHLPNAAQALAATGIGGFINFLLIAVAMGVSVGTTALVARFTGAGDRQGAIHATGQSLSLSLMLGLVFGTLFYWGRGYLAQLLLDAHRSPEACVLCTQFLGVVLLATVPSFMMNVLMSAFRGLGDMRTPMLVTVAVITTHLSGNALLIYGRLGFPRLGVRGAGIALALSMCVGATLYLLALLKSPLAEALHGRHLRLRSDWAWRILRIGLPAALQAIIRTLGMMSFTGMLARTVEGAAGVAALQIGVRAEAIAFMPGFGYSVAASTLVGQNLGARDPKRAEQCGWAATWQALVIMSLMALLFFTLAVPCTRLFTSDPMVEHLGAEYLRVLAFSEPFLALGMVLTGALQGAGDTLRPIFITFVTIWLARLPLGWWLMFSCHLQTRGAWYAMMITSILSGIMTVELFRSGKWKRIKV